jgi:hypothetical protein
MSVRARIILVLLIGAMLALYWPAVSSLWVLWLDVDATTYTHGLTGCGAVAVAAVARCARTGAADAGPQKHAGRGLFMGVLCLLVLGWQLAFRAGIQLGYLLLLPPLIWCAIRVSLGAAAARLAAFPLGFLYFAMPVWDYPGSARTPGHYPCGAPHVAGGRDSGLFQRRHGANSVRRFRNRRRMQWPAFHHRGPGRRCLVG